MFKSKWWAYTWFLGHFLVLAPLFLIPLEAVEHGPTLCLFKRFLGIECWGCGMTRAFFAVAQGEWQRAWAFNHLVVIVFPLLTALWAGSAWKAWLSLRHK